MHFISTHMHGVPDYLEGALLLISSCLFAFRSRRSAAVALRQFATDIRQTTPETAMAARRSL